MYHYKKHKSALPVMLVMDGKSENLLDKEMQKMAKKLKFSSVAGKMMVLPTQDKEICYFAGMDSNPSLRDWSIFAESFPAGIYDIINHDILDEDMRYHLVLAWGLSHYQYDRFRTKKKESARLILPKGKRVASAVAMAEALNWGRDLINHPANYLTPSKLAIEAENLARKHAAKFILTDGVMLKRSYPLVYAVGKAASDAPRMIEFKWSPIKSKKNITKLTLIGKGVCFDSGGLDLKPSKGMLLMKKDMGGAAHTLVLARLIMENNLPFQLRILIPAVENALSKDAFRPMDILKSRHGLSVEIGNTDAEGRLILADALTAASEENPDLIIDFATLTGAARIATGTDLPNLFSNREMLLDPIKNHGSESSDPLWPMPLFDDYKRFLKSDNADLTNAPSYSYAGSITAALFLEEFLTASIPWVHLDVMGWNLFNLPGKKRGGEIQGVRAVFQFLQELITKGVTIDEYETHTTRFGA